MKESIKIYRDKSGIPHIEAQNLPDLYWGMGHIHGTDRGMQILMMRILGQGRLSEQLDSSESSLEIDKFFRKMNWHNNIEEHIHKLTDFEKMIMDSYCEGVNEVFENKIPWELKLLGYKHESWQIRDVFIITRMVAYLTLTQSQEEIERLFVEMVQNNIPEDKLKELFPGILNELDIELLKKVHLPETIVPANLWNLALPRMSASNNWVISGAKTKSGKPILANDPHLEVNRLPNVWCEVAGVVQDKFIMGVSMPGTPAFIIGRNPNLAWGVTYSFADSVDSWVEECKDRKYKKEGELKKFRERKEIIKRKAKESYEITFYENEHGVLNGNPNLEGYYLATKWSACESGVKSFRYFLKMWDASSVEEGMDYLGQVESFWNWVLADNNGNIGYQMSGLVPIRRKGVKGFVPLPGWESKNDWQGFESYTDLPRIQNPKNGFFVTANQDLNKYGKCKPITMPMGSYRADRITSLLENGSNFSHKEICEMQYDLYSLQAELFMKVLKPLLPDTKQGRILKNWNYEYSDDSEGAFLFEKFYYSLFKEVFGKNAMGENVIDYFASQMGVFIDFYQNFDRILLSEKSLWFNGKTRNEVYQMVLDKCLSATPEPWINRRSLFMTNVLFNGKLPRFFGFDKGPVPIRGGRATIHQGQIYRSANRTTTFAPSYRMVTDLSENVIYTNIVGGPSDRRFSRWYTSDVKNWLSGIYKSIVPKSEKKMDF
ncbi:MAG: penicillin acylase family protein [Leptospiraceae bacterium]|nr:penicillin acylase family protein [Leptospiraceae bacterium]MCP5493950.1 penicillin acylase family protein [Leptospiraceae bacterium]